MPRSTPAVVLVSRDRLDVRSDLLALAAATYRRQISSNGRIGDSAVPIGVSLDYCGRRVHLRCNGAAGRVHARARCTIAPVTRFQHSPASARYVIDNRKPRRHFVVPGKVMVWRRQRLRGERPGAGIALGAQPRGVVVETNACVKRQLRRQIYGVIRKRRLVSEAGIGVVRVVVDLNSVWMQKVVRVAWEAAVLEHFLIRIARKCVPIGIAVSLESRLNIVAHAMDVREPAQRAIPAPPDRLSILLQKRAPVLARCEVRLAWIRCPRLVRPPDRERLKPASSVI